MTQSGKRFRVLAVFRMETFVWSGTAWHVKQPHCPATHSMSEIEADHEMARVRIMQLRLDPEDRMEDIWLEESI